MDEANERFTKLILYFGNHKLAERSFISYISNKSSNHLDSDCQSGWFEISDMHGVSHINSNKNRTH